MTRASAGSSTTRRAASLRSNTTSDKDATTVVKTTTTTTTTTAETKSAASSSSKRKQTDLDDNEEEDESSDNLETVVEVKKAKVVETAVKLVKKTSAGGSKGPMRLDAPTNTAMPDKLSYPAAPEGCIKIASWNVSGLNASLKKGFKTYIKAEDADVICIQEHKVNQPLLNLVDPKVYPFSWWGFEQDKKGYAGVAMFSKVKPLSVVAGLPTHPSPSDTKGRVVTLEFPTTYIVGCYVPNAGQGLVRLKPRMVWDVAMKEWLAQLKDKGKQVIWTGDLNVCHMPIDLRNPTTNTRSAGFTQEERDGFSAILKAGDFVDTFRERNPDAEGYYTYYSYRFQCRIKGIGWRLDYFVTDKKMNERVKESVIREDAYGASDHVPIVLVVEGDL
ncbi:hypothetical protein DFQ27_001660 [Actinomortierella ambigua]|uniref:DNA-(apurinic or apyrimidinic site) endonuclease n=1 Tax=Actinomortierella ambigua TaxID=1343610 RepID=A0A9P6U7A9_9FUNG|nr:hypothetical protein DFQ26_008332 [Actinomortierella ambigua]KAG0263649.1 hypothetical protein DFQ27_001660 [Actinomortierella ambigua]